jgi:hypothetical protein
MAESKGVSETGATCDSWALDRNEPAVTVLWRQRMPATKIRKNASSWLLTLIHKLGCYDSVAGLAIRVLPHLLNVCIADS